ncbi:hypothetical protein F0562_012213 [Nyssa sinensis]|uniref:Cathepsin propeptide inhibitor domain-containing protein n=1 Tax=Nyssa sinensis TaxID=561372 RepID=A0A5J4ZSX8_9ASTE|nr:hypothetical protein F0562_012213 [Nyssa sinensis]
MNGRARQFDLGVVEMSTSEGVKLTGRSKEEVRSMFEEWRVKHKKTYENEEEKEKRFNIFKDKLKMIDAHNAGNHSWTMGLNQFSDRTSDELKNMYGGRGMV